MIMFEQMVGIILRNTVRIPMICMNLPPYDSHLFPNNVRLVWIRIPKVQLRKVGALARLVGCGFLKSIKASTQSGKEVYINKDKQSKGSIYLCSCNE